MDFKSYLKETAGDLDHQVQAILNDWLKEVEKTNPKLVPLAKAFIEACKGGKKIRGSLCKLGYEIAKVHLGGVPSTSLRATVRGVKEILKVGAAFEIFHASILAHDDIIDQSDLRRGLPTLYQVLGGDHYGISQTIALGDVGFFLAVKIIAESDFKDEFKNKALGHFAKTVINTGLGEVLDMEVPHLSGQGTGYSGQEEDVIAIHTLKTAQYTISGPLILGAILAGASIHLGGVPSTSLRATIRGELSSLAEFGENLGIAFQIQDDILGVFGDEKELGKSVTSDIEEGKNTLLITEALKRANSAQRKILDRYYGKGSQGSEGLKEVRQVFLETGALDYSRQFAVKYVMRAKSVIPRVTKDKRMVKLLTEMADFLVERSK